jgi:hypothetical protein
MLLSQAFTNVRRQLNRTLLSVWVMAIAAMVLTSGLSFSQGTARLSSISYRDYYGADIMVMSPGYIGAAPLNNMGEALHTRLLLYSDFNLLARLYPDFVSEGYLAAESWRHEPLGSKLLADIGSHANVAGVQPYYTLPAGVGEHNIDLRPFPVSEENLFELTGRRPESCAGNSIEVVINAFGTPEAKPGDVLVIEVPRIFFGASGVPYADRTQSVSQIAATVVGVIKRPTRSLGSNSGVEQGYVHLPDVYVSWEQWQFLWKGVAGGQQFPAVNAGIRLDNMSELNGTLSELRSSYPHLSFLSVQEIATHVERFALIDHFYSVDPHLWMSYEAGPVQRVVPRDFGRLSALLMYLTAGLMLATQMMARMAERRREIGVMKAIGARQREVVGMIVMECLILAVTGASIGFVAIRLMAVHQAVTNAVPIATILAHTGYEYALVLGVTTMIAAAFSYLPARHVAALTVMEVFRSD